MFIKNETKVSYEQSEIVDIPNSHGYG